MTNAEWIIKQGIKFSDIHILWWKDIGNGKHIYKICKYNCSVNNFIGEIEAKITDISIEKAFMNWLDMEHKGPVLDDAEKKYLSAVIKPFRDKIRMIGKTNYGSKEFITIYFSDENATDMDFPEFPYGKMYKGMEPGRKYTLEELDL